MSLLSGDEFKYQATSKSSTAGQKQAEAAEGAEAAVQDVAKAEVDRGSQLEAEDENEWSSEDIDNLVEGISEFQNDWDQIASEVMKNKFSAAQCVLKFLELPLTENMLAKIGAN